MSQSAVQLRSLPRLHSCEQQGSERVGKAEEYMYLQVKRSHWPTLSPDCRLWTLRDFALQHSNWDSFTDKGKLRVIYELGALLCESGDKLKEDAMLKARNDLQLAVTEARQLPRVVRSDKLRATAVARLCEGLNLPSAARRLKEALGAAKREEYDTANLCNLAKKFHFKGYIQKIEDRSITVTQLRRVLKYCSEVCHHWYELPKDEVANPSAGPALSMEVLNLYHIDSWLIWPATEAYRSSFIELMAEQAQPANWCVSHCWSQPHTSLVECISQHVQTRSLHRSSNFWIWAYAHRHHSALSEAPESGFCDALSLAEGRLLLLLQDVPDGAAAVQSTPFDRLWCMFEVLQCLAMGRDRAMTRTPLDLAVFSGNKANVMTYNMTEAEEAMDCRSPGSGSAEKALREKDFPVSVIAASLQQRLEVAEMSWDEDRARLLELMGVQGEASTSHSCRSVNTRLNGLFALMFLRKIFEEKDQADKEEPVDLKDLAAEALSQDTERLEIDITLGAGCGSSTDDELLLLVKHLSPRLQRITLDLKGSRLKNASLAEVANYLSPDVQDILLDLQGCRSITDTGIKRFMDNLIDNCDRSKLSTVSCLLMGTKVAEHSQQACEILDLEEIAQVRSELELQERKNQIKRLMKNVDQGKTAIASFKRLLQSNVEVALHGVLGEQGFIDASHVEWGIHSKEMAIAFDQTFLKVLLDVGATIEFMKRPEAPPYSVLWPQEGPDRDAESRSYKVHHRHEAFMDLLAEKLKEVQPSGRRAVAALLLEARTGDLIRAALPSASSKLAFIYAAREGSRECVSSLLLTSGGLLTQVDDASWDDEDLALCSLKDAREAPRGSALHGAALNGHSEVVQKLIDWGADVNQMRFDTDATALILAAQKGWLEVVSILLENGAEIEARDIQGRTPLSWASGNGHVHVVEELVERSAHLDLPDLKGMTPLMYAAGIGQVPVAEKLIECKANIRAVDKEEKTAAMHATIYDTDKMGLQQKKQKILDMLQLREKELEREAEREAERELERAALERERQQEAELEAESEGQMTPMNG